MHGAEPARRGTLGSGETVEIIYAAAADGHARRRGRQWTYYFSPETGTERGDGSEVLPWPDLASALAAIGKLHDAGDDARQLRAGDRLRLTRREVFAASPTERRKAAHRPDCEVRLGRGHRGPCPAAPRDSDLPAHQGLALAVAEFLLENPKDYMTAGGIWAPLVGTIYLVTISLALATPIGVLAGVYLNEYAGDNWLTRVVNLAVVNLAGVPSIVHALFGVGAFVLFAGMGRSVLAASCTLAIMTLPVIIASTREALAAVPQSFREACWNMGASRWQTIRTIVLPNSISGILTGVILQVSRAAGETAPILFTGAVFYVGVPDHGMESVLPVRPVRPLHGAVVPSLHHFDPGNRCRRESAVCGCHRALRSGPGRECPVDRLSNLPAITEKMVASVHPYRLPGRIGHLRRKDRAA